MSKSFVALITDGIFLSIHGIAPTVSYVFYVEMTKSAVCTITEDLYMLGKFCLLRSVKNPRWFYGGKQLKKDWLTKIIDKEEEWYKKHYGEK